MSGRKVILTSGLLFLATWLWSQDKEFVASAPASVRLGQQFQYSIQGNEQGQIQLPDLNDFELLAGPFTSFSSSTQWVNGKMNAETVASYTYILRGNLAGDFTIPPSKVKVRKEIYETNSVQVTITGADAPGTQNPISNASGSSNTQNTSEQQQTEDQQVFLKVIPSKFNVYVGEQFVSELKVFTSVNTRPSSGLKEVPYEGFYKQTLDPDQSSSRENINGQIHVTQVLQRHVLIPQKAGKLVIEPFESEWTIPRRVSKSRSGSVFDQFFDDPFFNGYQDVPVTIATRPVTINVKPLPDGAPAGFTGGVGNFNFSANLSTDEVKVNDAINLVVKISGTGNIPLLGEPKINFPPDHDVYETSKSIKISTSGNRVSGTVTYEFPIVARHAGNFRIAPVSFSWFDPTTGKYETVTTGEFNFTVEKGEGTEEGSQIYMPGLRAEKVENIGTDILDIDRSVPDFSPIGKSQLNNTAYWGAYILMLLLFLGAVIFLRLHFRQKADIRLIRNRKANKMAKSRLKIADKARKANDTSRFFEETEKAIWGYLADKLNIELSALSRDKVTTLLQSYGISGAEIKSLLSLLEECEFSRYAPSSEKSEMNALYGDAIKMINNFEQNIRMK